MGQHRRGLSWGRACAQSGAVIASTALVLGLGGAAMAPLAGAQTLSPTSASSAGLVKVDPGIARLPGATVSVIVQAWPGRVTEGKAAVRAHGATVGIDLSVIDGFEVRGTVNGLLAAAASPAIKAITANRKGAYTSTTPVGVASKPLTAATGSDAKALTSASEFVKSTGANLAWQKGDTGSGVGVAVIDTGISNMSDVAGRVTWGPDLSGEGITADTYGHGTVMASLIGGAGADSAANGGGYTGVAPGVNLIAVKTAGYNGSADVSTILQAFSWVAAYQAQYNIRVVNLSWGTPSTQDPKIDPLDYAVERLWNSGIVVVVAAGNAGPGPRTISKPGDDPMVLTVGAYDDHRGATMDTVPAWSSRGPTAAGVTKPDVIAPGRTLIAQRSWGSNIEVSNPLSLIAPSYITGSGTSEATAVTSGLAALVIAAHPTWTPDQVKATLKGTATPISGLDADDQGAGRVRVAQAIAAAPGPAMWQASPATGLGSIEASRGGNDVVALCDGVATPITGEIDVRCEAWNPAAWVGHSWTGSSWTGSSWTGSSWTGSSWTGSSWTGGTWTGHSWTGHSWTGSSWTGASWTGSTWTGHSWTTVNCPTAATTGKQQTAFWGKHPKKGMKVNGEQSDS